LATGEKGEERHDLLLHKRIKGQKRRTYLSREEKGKGEKTEIRRVSKRTFPKKGEEKLGFFFFTPKETRRVVTGPKRQFSLKTLKKKGETSHNHKQGPGGKKKDAGEGGETAGRLSIRGGIDVDKNGN